MSRPESFRARWLACGGAGAILLSSAAGWSQTASDKAAAEALFRQAADLMEAQSFQEACAKYQASQQLDPALGTLLRLADCYDRTGKTASAWALFAEAEALALRAEQPERAEMAAARSAELKERLSLLALEVPIEHRVEGLAVVVNGGDIPEASFGTLLPFDPGVQNVEVSAPGHETWSQVVELPPGPVERSLAIGPLKPKPLARAKENTQPIPAPTQARSSREEPVPASSGQAALGYVIGATGLVGLAAAGAFAYRAYTLNQDSLKYCAKDDPNACTVQGKNLRDDAAGSGSLASVVGGAGGALLLAGFALVITAPSTPSKSDAASVWLRPELGQRSSALVMQGVW